MTQPYLKVPLDISFTAKARRGEMTVQYGAIAYYKVKGLPCPYHILYALRPDTVRYVEVTGDTALRPHRDHSGKTVLNCYFESAGDETIFWVPKPDAEAVNFPGAITANIFEEKDLIRVCSFKANDGDAYLLDVSHIHSVYRGTGDTRRFIQLNWINKSLKQVTELLVKAGMV